MLYEFNTDINLECETLSKALAYIQYTQRQYTVYTGIYTYIHTYSIHNISIQYTAYSIHNVSHNVRIIITEPVIQHSEQLRAGGSTGKKAKLI